MLQNVEFVSGGDKLAAQADKIFAKSVFGKSVLDVCCGKGDLCFEAGRRGAVRVVGYDLDPDRIVEARATAARLASKAEFVLGDIASRTPDGNFDYILCDFSNCISPLTTLDQLIPIARERLVIRVPAIGHVLSWLPIVLVGRNGSTGKHRREKFYFAKRALARILKMHRGSLAKVEVISDGAVNLVICHKQRVGHLIVVSGPVSAGKTTFCEQLRSGALPEIAATIGIEPGKGLPLMGTSRKAQPVESGQKAVLFHYGFLRPYLRPAVINERDEALDVLNAAEKLTFLTIWAPPDVLVERITRGEIATKPANRSSERHLRLRDEYRSLERVIDHYEQWIAYTMRYAANHYFVVEASGKPRLISIDEWRDVLRSMRETSGSIWKPHSESENHQNIAKLASLIFPASLSGKSVLDVSCGRGFLCFEAVRRGAQRVVGFDVNRDNIHWARCSKEPGAAQVKFELRNFDSSPTAEEFDYVLCLGDLDHLRDPLGRIQRLCALARETLAMDFAGFTSRDTQWKLSLPRVIGSFLDQAPIMLVGRNGTASSRGWMKFITTPAAMRNILQRHRKFFSNVTFTRLKTTGRHLAVAEKLQINHLIVVAGPVSAGKSTFCRRLIKGELEHVFGKLGVGPSERPTEVYLPRARGSSSPAGKKTVLFHYNFLNPYVSLAGSHGRDENLDILTTAKRLTFLTIWASPQRLVKQITSSEIEGGPFHRPAARHQKLKDEYGDPLRVHFHYENWLSFVAQKGGEHFIVYLEENNALMSTKEWRAIASPQPFQNIAARSAEQDDSHHLDP